MGRKRRITNPFSEWSLFSHHYDEKGHESDCLLLTGEELLHGCDIPHPMRSRGSLCGFWRIHPAVTAPLACGILQEWGRSAGAALVVTLSPGAAPTLCV